MAVTPRYVLLFVTLLASHVLAQSEIAGDITEAAPYGITPDLFANLTEQPTAQNWTLTGGFDISQKKNDSQMDWTINVAVTADVPLTNATDQGVDTSKVTETTVLSLLPLFDVGKPDLKSWQVCALVFPHLIVPTNATNATGNEDLCSFLPRYCRTGMLQTASPGCPSVDLGGGCAQYFEGGNATGTGYTLDAATLEDGRFFAYGSAPTEKGNATAIAEAEAHVWPIGIVWKGPDSNAGFSSCFRASNESVAAPSGLSQVSGSSKNTVHILVAVLTGAATMAALF